MSSPQISLLSGDALSQHRFTLEALLTEDLRAIAQWAHDDDVAQRWELEQLLTAVGAIAGELRRIGSSDTEVPF